MSNDNADDDLKSLVEQLKDTTLVNNTVQKKPEEFHLDKDDIEDFVVQNSGKLITESLDVMNNVKDYIMASGDPDSIGALSDLIRASSGAIESLNKIVIQNKRSSTSIVTKKMDVDAKYAIEEKKNENALIGTREEIFKRVLSEAKVIDATDVTSVSSSDQ